MMGYSKDNSTGMILKYHLSHMSDGLSFFGPWEKVVDSKLPPSPSSSDRVAKQIADFNRRKNKRLKKLNKRKVELS
ncbi:hypothetical protein SHAb15599_00091 [Acinetobacter phage SH-Ab 15599]|nr:hypothetical protein SHAb15599_00091 [Acinetobacter phage SH-Ab 15599]